MQVAAVEKSNEVNRPSVRRSSTFLSKFLIRTREEIRLDGGNMSRRQLCKSVEYMHQLVP